MTTKPLSVLVLLVSFFIIGYLGYMNKEKNFSSLNVSSFKEKIESGKFVLIDVRTMTESIEGSIPETMLLLDFYGENFEKKLNKLDKKRKYLIYCRSGNRSGQTLSIMQELGFETAYDLANGFNVWDS
ncbi:MAG: rhodanese-like domain-containing protein [Candidatus Peregrinibacteria bacterium]|nr:rhodanese-like domain-containing protein [Candidatus Peregrinibacteria bacterium]